MPIYDLMCTSCGYEKGETIFSSYDAFQKAEKERECPECHERLEAKISSFATKNVKTTNGKIVEKCLEVSIALGIAPCGHIIPKGVHVAQVTKVRRDPEMN